MYCPACATQNTDETDFCRSCGEDLRMVRAVVKKGLSSTLIKEAAQLDEALKQKNKLNIRRDLLNIFFGIFLIAVFVVTGSFNSFVGYVSILISCLMIGVGIGGVQKYRAGLSASNRQTELSSATNTKELLQGDTAEMIEPGSVTEGTTKHLDASYKTNK